MITTKPKEATKNNGQSNITLLFMYNKRDSEMNTQGIVGYIGSPPQQLSYKKHHRKRRAVSQ